jgi:RND family efflux transporter MFP subunit
MNALKPMPGVDETAQPVQAPFPTETGRSPDSGRNRPGVRFFIACGLLLAGGVGYGVWQHLKRGEEVAATAEQFRDFIPTVRVAQVRGSDSMLIASLPGTTEAFEAANIYSRTSGYIGKRYVDIGDKVKTGELLAEITAPELDHLISQAQATLAQNQATLRQVQSNMEIASVTWGRDGPLVDKGWVTRQQGDQERLTLQAQTAAVAVAEANIRAQQAQLLVLGQQKAYQRVVAPFDGVITQRNIDNGSLVQADAAGGTSMFTLMHSDVIRIQLYVPQDQAFGLAPGVEATVTVPELPGNKFHGTVTRVASALQPGTRTLLTEIDVPNPDGILTPGTYCEVQLQIPRKTPSMIVPSEAIIFNRNGLQAAVVENGAAHIRKLRVVRDLGTTVEVNDGVKDGDQVILNPPVNIVEGEKVKTNQVDAGKL